MRDGTRTQGRQERTHLPAVVVGVLLGAVSLTLIGVSIFVEGPRPQAPPPTGGIVTAVTPTELGSGVGVAIPGS